MKMPAASELRMVGSLSRRAIAARVPKPGYPASSAATGQEPAFKHVMINLKIVANKIADHGLDNSPRLYRGAGQTKRPPEGGL
jgi:hypothetical protein